jgi:hypothetical protein
MTKQGPGPGVVLDFYFLEMLTPYRTKMELRTFQSVIYVLYAFLVPIVAMVALGLSLVAKGFLTERPESAFAVVLLFVVGNLYVIGSYLFREIFSERRFVVASSPNTPFYRAFDIPARHVFAVYAGLRATAFYVILFVADAVFVVVATAAVPSAGPGVPVLLTLPVAGYLSTLAVAATVAASRVRSMSWKPPWLLAGVVTLVAVGYLTARFVAGPIAASGLAKAFAGQRVALLTSAVAVIAPAVACGALLLVGIAVRRLGRTSFLIHPAEASNQAPRRPQIHKLQVLHRELVRSKVYPLVRRNVLVMSTVLLLCLGAAASGSGVLPLRSLPDRFGLTVEGFAFVSFIIMVGLVFTVVGPTTLAGQFRFEWENLLGSRRRIAVAAACYYALPALVTAAGLSVLLLLVTGAFSIGPVALAVAVAAAAMIAETTVAPREMADGSSTQATISALIVLLLGVPVIAALSASSAVLDGLSVVYSLGLLAGGIACMIRRIQRLPLRSAT